MTKLLRRFMLCRQGVTAIEYALIASGVALAIVTGVSTAGTQLSSALPISPARFRSGASQGVLAPRPAGAGRKPTRTPPSIAFASRQVTT